MINANAARAMYHQPTYTLAEVEQSIQQRALTSDYTCFEYKRWSGQLTETLNANGFTVTPNTIGDVIVSWKPEERAA